MVLLIRFPYEKWLAIIGGIPHFQTYPYSKIVTYDSCFYLTSFDQCPTTTGSPFWSSSRQIRVSCPLAVSTPADFCQVGSGGEAKWAMNKIPWWIDYYRGLYILPGLLGIMMGPIGLGNRFQPTTNRDRTKKNSETIDFLSLGRCFLFNQVELWCSLTCHVPLCFFPDKPAFPKFQWFPSSSHSNFEMLPQKSQ